VTDDDFRRLIAGYLSTANPEMAGIEIDHAPGHEGYGLDHALAKHDVRQDEIEQVLREFPAPEEKRSREDPKRTLFWGATRAGRWLTVVTRDERHGTRRKLTLITAFDETDEQWRQRR